jgi:uncharacterized protein
MEWYNEPPSWSANGATISLQTGPRTDFWRKTHYGFIRDNGHFYHRAVKGDFVAEVSCEGDYRALYDQAGLMVRLDERVWMKCGIEYVGGVQHLSAVVTREFSDWSVIPLADPPPAIRLRVTRRGEALEMHYALNGDPFHMLRLAHFTLGETLQVGPMACSPEGDGFQATFEGFQVGTP